jgi:hypothetical protein
MFMSVDRRLARAVGLVLVTWERSLAAVGCTASAGADVLAAARVRLLPSSDPPQQPMPRDGVADIIVLSKKRKHER